jgi:hypothetical protein
MSNEKVIKDIKAGIYRAVLFESPATLTKKAQLHGVIYTRALDDFNKEYWVRRQEFEPNSLVGQFLNLISQEGESK